LAVVVISIAHFLSNDWIARLTTEKKLTVKIMNINKAELQVQTDEYAAHTSDLATALSFFETYKLQSGAIDWTQVSALPVR